MDRGNWIKGDVYLEIPDEGFALAIGKLLMAWNLFEDYFDLRWRQLSARHKPLEIPFSKKAAAFTEGFRELGLADEVYVKLEAALLTAERAQHYRNAMAHRPFQITMDFRGTLAFPALQVEIGPKQSKQPVYVTVADLKEHTNALLHAGGLLSNLDLGIENCWPARELGDRDKDRLQAIFTEPQSPLGGNVAE